MPVGQSHEFEPELRMGTPRPARVKAQARRELQVITLFTLVIAWIICWFASRDLDGLYALRAHGVTGQATVTDKRKTHSKSDSFYLSYSLQERGIEINDEDQVSESVYEQKRQGDPLPVTYLPERPQIYRLGHVRNERAQARTAAWALGLLAWLGLLGLGLATSAYEHRKELRLARYGVPVAATISDCKAPQPNTKTTNDTVTYRFAAPDGEHTGVCSVSGEVSKNLATGHTVTAFYDPANPRRACLYCAFRYTEIA